MSRDPTPNPDDPAPPEPGPGRIRTSGPATLVPAGLIGLVLGWAIRPLSISTGRVAPAVPGLSVALIFFVAAILAGAAYFTWRTLHREGRRMPAHHAVNRLVLGKTCALVGAVLLGGYLGNAISHLGVGEGYAQTQVWWSLAAALGGLALMVSALLLERACRVRGSDE